jgi:Tfp pilus assembly protein PilF
MKLFTEALSDYDKAIHMDSSEPKYFHAKGLTYQTAGDEQAADEQKEYYEQAVSLFLLSIEADENFLSSVFHAGLMYRQLH